MLNKSMTAAMAAALAGAMMLAACGGGGDSAKEKRMEAEAAKYGVDADVELDAKGDVKSLTVNNGLGAKVGMGLSLPADFPADVPLDPAWSIVAVSPAPTGGYMINALAEGARAQDVIASLRSGLGANGWSEGPGGTPTPQMTQFSFTKDDRLTSGAVIDAGGRMSIQIVTMKNPG